MPPAIAILVGRLALAFTLLALWQAAARFAGSSSVAEPFDVAARMFTMIESGSIVPHLIATLRVSAIGFAIGSATGAVLPLLFHPWPHVVAAVEPLVNASAGIPKYALMPTLILWLGIDDAPKLWLVGLLVFYPTFAGVLAGARHIDARLLNTILVLGAGRLAVVRLVVWPSLLPFAFATLRITVPRAISAAIVAEFLVGSAGLGSVIETARQTFDTVGLFAGVALATLVVTVATTLVRRIELSVLAWRRDQAEGPA